MVKTTLPRLFLSPPHMGGEEQRFVSEAFESNYIAPLGPQVDAFEREFIEKVGIGHAVALSSGTAAMHLALRILGVSSGDEVFASSLTFIGSVTPVVFQGATPVLIDCDRTSWNMDPELLAEELEACSRRGQLPKAVVPTDLYGQCADLDRILEICEPYGIPVVVDAAEALGATYGRSENGKAKTQRHAGVGAKAAVFSFNGNKIITTSGGGMLVSDDEALIEKARFLSQQARDPAPHYEHTEIGYNYRMSNIVAAIGRGQLRVLDERVEKKRWIFEHYRQALGDLPGIELMPEAPYGRCTRWLTVALIHPEEFGVDRETVRMALEEQNIESRPVWKPMHMQPVFGGSNGKMPEVSRQTHRARVVGGKVSEYLFERGLCLPSGTQMSEADLERVVARIRKVHADG
jgi:dTDP-4-amino-4,6-dideoxygalactose transaminase